MALLRVDHHEQRGKCWKCRHHFGRCLRSSFKLKKDLTDFVGVHHSRHFVLKKVRMKHLYSCGKWLKKTKGTSINITEIPKQGGETSQSKYLTLDTSTPPAKNYTCPFELHETEPQDAAILPGRKWGLPASGLPGGYLNTLEVTDR